MRAFTSCAGCGDYLRFLTPRHNTHALCDDPRQSERDLETAFLAAACAGAEPRADALAAELDALNERPVRYLDAALVYASWGWPVFPLHPGTKIPLTAHGFKSATTHMPTIRKWWQKTPRANIGLPTGVHFDVIDVDYRVPGTWARWLALQDAPELPPLHGIVSTASNGLHAYIHPQGAGNTAGRVPGIDYRGTGGYVVAPPSTMGQDRAWAWHCYPSPFIKAARP